MPFTVDTDQIRAASTDITRIAGEIESSVAAMMGKIQGLEAGAWRGGAAADFQALMTRWRGLQTQVRESLAAVGQLTAKAGTSYETTENSVRSLFAS